MLIFKPLEYIFWSSHISETVKATTNRLPYLHAALRRKSKEWLTWNQNNHGVCVEEHLYLRTVASVGSGQLTPLFETTKITCGCFPTSTRKFT